MSKYPDQHLIDELFRQLKGEKKNGHSENGRANPGGSKFTDQAVLEKIFRERERGEEFRDTYHGDYKKHQPHWTNSEAVASILRKAAFYSGNDPLQMDRLIRGSALSCPKFDEARGGSTWLAAEIAQAITDTPEPYQPHDGASLTVGGRDKASLNGAQIHSFDAIGVEDSNESFSLPFKTAKEIATETSEETDWLVRPWIAKKTITEVSGAIKTSGKTTWLTCMSRKALDGESFMGEPTKKTAVVYLTEQAPTSFRRALKMARLEEREDFHALYWHQAMSVTWPEIVRQATDHASEVGAELLIVDVISRWTGLLGDSENSAGAALEAMKPLKEAVGRGLTVVYARHDRKGGGDVGESGRGSSQFGGDADQLLHLKRPGGNTRKTVRVLEAVGRFADETPEDLMIELDIERGEYKSLGDAGAFVEREAEQVVLEILPTTIWHALKTEEVVDKAQEHNCKRSAVINALNKLSEDGTIKRIGKGKKGDARRYYKPLPDQEDEGTEEVQEELHAEEEIHSFETPTLKDQTNESEGTETTDEAEQESPKCIHDIPVGDCHVCSHEERL